MPEGGVFIHSVFWLHGSLEVVHWHLNMNFCRRHCSYHDPGPQQELLKKDTWSIFQLLNTEHVQLCLATLTSIPGAWIEDASVFYPLWYNQWKTAVGCTLADKGQCGRAFRWSRKCYIFCLHNLTQASLTLKAEVIENNSRQPNISQPVRDAAGDRWLHAS